MSPEFVDPFEPNEELDARKALVTYAILGGIARKQAEREADADPYMALASRS